MLVVNTYVNTMRSLIKATVQNNSIECMWCVRACMLFIRIYFTNSLSITFAIGTKIWNLSYTKWPANIFAPKICFNAITKFLFSFLWNKSFVLASCNLYTDRPLLFTMHFCYTSTLKQFTVGRSVDRVLFRTQCNQHIYTISFLLKKQNTFW